VGIEPRKPPDSGVNSGVPGCVEGVLGGWCTTVVYYGGCTLGGMSDRCVPGFTTSMKHVLYPLLLATHINEARAIPAALATHINEARAIPLFLATHINEARC